MDGTTPKFWSVKIVQRWDDPVFLASDALKLKKLAHQAFPGRITTLRQKAHTVDLEVTRANDTAAVWHVMFTRPGAQCSIYSDSGFGIAARDWPGSAIQENCSSFVPLNH